MAYGVRPLYGLPLGWSDDDVQKEQLRALSDALCEPRWGDWDERQRGELCPGEAEVSEVDGRGEFQGPQAGEKGGELDRRAGPGVLVDDEHEELGEAEEGDAHAGEGGVERGACADGELPEAGGDQLEAVVHGGGVPSLEFGDIEDEVEEVRGGAGDPVGGDWQMVGVAREGGDG